MYYKKLISLVYVTLSCTAVLGKLLSKEEVLRLYKICHDDTCNNINYYCKDDICSEYDSYNKTLEFPVQDGNMVKYIVDTCSPSEINSGKCESEKCTADSQCLSNQCLNNHCVFNEATPIVFCEDIYQNEEMVISCGKPFGDSCANDNDCSSKNCNNGICEEEKPKNGKENKDFRILSKGEVLKLKLCNDGNCDSPQFYCINDNCVERELNNESTEYTDKDGKKVNYIADTCSITNINSGKCDSRKCTADSQCFSNKCVNHHCALSEGTTVNECRSISKSGILFDSDEYEMHCGKSDGSECVYNEDCYSLNCKNSVCESEQNTEGLGIGRYFLRIIIVFVIFGLIGGIGCFFCFSSKDKSEGKKKQVSSV
ncbi:hypothetical protein PIROE2DRAFT_9109 [Piromyces sp. E2]|nr:hypothetical protein PIROE2DRAFT_9109 [Piromyces sp. E2]|eukprot:OUM64201.1 hypothetical protein PIROE2DRAFT_9109 [Piromyces sp. E2]